MCQCMSSWAHDADRFDREFQSSVNGTLPSFDPQEMPKHNRSVPQRLNIVQFAWQSRPLVLKSMTAWRIMQSFLWARLCGSFTKSDLAGVFPLSVAKSMTLIIVGPWGEPFESHDLTKSAQWSWKNECYLGTGITNAIGKKRRRSF